MSHQLDVWWPWKGHHTSRSHTHTHMSRWYLTSKLGAQRSVSIIILQFNYVLFVGNSYYQIEELIARRCCYEVIVRAPLRWCNSQEIKKSLKWTLIRSSEIVSQFDHRQQHICWSYYFWQVDSPVEDFLFKMEGTFRVWTSV